MRLSKVTRDLNVGLLTVVEFLQKEGFVVKKDINTKISEEQYELLVKEFSKDIALKSESGKISQKPHQRDKKEYVESYERPQKDEEIKTKVSYGALPEPVVIGKIDLTQVGKSPKQEKPQDQKTLSTSTRTKKKEKTVSKSHPEPESGLDIEIKGKQRQDVVKEPRIEKIPANKPEVKLENELERELESASVRLKESVEPQEEKNKNKQLETVLIPVPQEGTMEKNRAESEQIEREHISIKVEQLPGPKVVDTIDLTTINVLTRPVKKTKTEWRKEREEQGKKAAQEIQEKQDAVKNNAGKGSTPIGSTDGRLNDKNKKKKRRRIGQIPINIEKGISPKVIRSGSNTIVKPVLRKPERKNEISEEDIQKQIKDTLAKLTNKGQKRGAKYRREKREEVSKRQTEQQKMEMQDSRVIKLTEFVTANDLATMMNVPVIDIISTCMSIGIIVSINQRLDAETINIVADEFGYKTEYVSADVLEAITEEEDSPEDLLPRPPIVTVMGHVDHGKTSLLDNIRNTNVIAGEAGGITQHIGAYHVKLADGQRITFLDTPGHEAFTAMRARGASVTDIAIIIIAADDSVMPQTVEAINHASAAGVPIVFAINKTDKPGANPDKIKEALAAMNYLVEEWGGKYQSRDISAKQGIGVQELLEKVLLEAEMLDLKANPKRKATGTVIESSLDKGRGYVVTILVKNGTLRQGDIVLAGKHYGKVKAMFNERNQKIKQAGPARPVLILGLNGAPTSGDTIHVMDTEQEAREITTKREQLQREQGLRTTKRLTLDDIGRRIAISGFQQLNIIVKGDVDGSVEALSDSLLRLTTEQIQINIIHKGVGQISESDVILAAASDAIIVGFQVRPSQQARKQAEKEGVDIRLYSVIYNAIEEVKLAMEGMLAPKVKEEITGNVEILEVFKIAKVGNIAGCIVRDGKIKRGNKIRIIRDGIVAFTGELGSLKRFKDDVKEVTQGFECGLNIQNYNDIKVGDIVEAFEEVEVKQTL
ncbi:MAG: translation initiation factor IF-2 [Dysgonamonadaceae bacterium]|jgi:translation initiation factor IF-2|nr:translation initiation factor IF-2 [Dysgonamonadaceae bacterium]